MSDMEEVLKIVMRKCAEISSGEKVFIVTDTNKKDIAYSFLDGALKFTKNSTLACMETRTVDGEEPTDLISKAMKMADIVFEVTTHSLTHTQASKSAAKEGVKIISIPAANKEVLKRCVDVNYQEMEKRTTHLSKILTDGSTAKVKTEKGTDLKLDIEGAKGISMHGICQNGDFINLPDGEALISPTGASGKVVVDGSMPPDSETKWGKIGKVKTPIGIKVKNNQIVDINGGEEAKVLKNLFKDFTEKVKEVAEFGIGTNSQAKVTGNVTEDEKAMGTVHIAFGNSANIGGDNESPVHLDGVIKSPNAWVDGKKIMEKGDLVV